jgi:hypothetical protein
MSLLEDLMRQAPNHWSVAQVRTLAATLVGFSFAAVTARFLSCRVPTLPGGRLSAAYDVPPSATNRAQRAMALRRMNVRILSTGRVSPYWVPEAPLPGPRVPFCPNAGWVDWVRGVLAVEAGALVTD